MKIKSTLLAAWAGLLIAISGGVSAQNNVGSVVFAEGMVSAQQAGQPSRFLTKDDAFREGEVLSTASRGYAVIRLDDGTRITLRPNTSFAVDQLSQRAGEESMAMRLLRGGLRAITGAISKRAPNQVRLNALTSTIGIRGTDFTARICGPECRLEAQGVRPPVAVPPSEPVVARVALMQGEATAVSAVGGGRRALAYGAALFNGETVQTGAASYVVLAFRDQSKATVTASSEFRLEDVRFAQGQPEQGSFGVRLLTGGLRLLTGLVARRDQRAVRVATPVGTIGIRGTGVDARTTPERDFAYTWRGRVSMEFGVTEILVDLDRAGAMDRKVGPELLAAVPQFFLDEVAPRPDQVDVDFEKLFEVRRIVDYAPGIYVGVRSGNVGFYGQGGGVDIGPFEAALMEEGSDRPALMSPLPNFLFSDRYPAPDEDFQPLRQIELFGPGIEAASQECEVR